MPKDEEAGKVLADSTGTRYYPKTNVTSGEYLYVIAHKKE